MIRRIIVGVAIGLILFLCRKHLGLNAYALEYQKAYSIEIGPNSVCYTLSGTEYCPNIQGWYFSGLASNVYGFEYTGAYGIFGQKWYIPVNGAVNNTAFDNGIGDVTFMYVSEGAIADYTEPYTFEMAGIYRGHYSCESTSSVVATIPYDQYNEGAYVRSVRYTAVRCPNVPLDQDYRIVQTTGIFVNGKVAISPPTWALRYENSSNQQVIDAINNGNTAITNAVDDVNDTLTDSSTDDPSSDLEDMQDYVPSNGTISQLLTLPITLYQNILNSVNGSCSSFQLGSLLGTNLSLPCINLQNILGSTLYGVIDILCSGLFILSFRKKMVDIFNHMTSLNDRGNELE